MPAAASIRIVTNDPTGAFQSLIIRGAHEIAEPEGYRLVVDTQLDGIRGLTTREAQGLLVIANAVPIELLVDHYKRNLPITLVSHQVPHTSIPTVMFHNAQGIRLLAHHLVKDCARRNLVFIRGVSEQIDAYERESSFRTELMRHSLPAENALFVAGGFDPSIAVKSVAELLKTRVHFDGVLAADYVMAAAVVRFLREYGIQVPEQIAVVGFGDADAARNEGVTTVAADVQELGRRATLQLLSQMRGTTIRGVTRLAVQLIMRASSIASVK